MFISFSLILTKKDVTIYNGRLKTMLRRCTILELIDLRNSIDEIDSEILKLFEKRMNVCKQVAQYKKENNLPIFQGGREDEVIEKIRSQTTNESLKNGTATLFTTIMDISKHPQQQEMLKESKELPFPSHVEAQLEKAKKIGCQGISGSNSETAASMIFGDKIPFSFYSTFEEVFEAVENGEIDYGVIPIHNSTAGSVTQTYDLMSKYDTYIVKSVCVEINHCLAVKENVDISEISDVISHPQALSQCSDYITKRGFSPISHSNTATAAEHVANSDEKLAAICSEDCAKQFSLKILARNIANSLSNYTKFICISKNFELTHEADTISVILKLQNTQGSLYRLLTKFTVNGLNLDKLESRPIKDGSFDVMFYLDFKGNIFDKSVEALIADLSQNLEFFKFLGVH